MSLNVKNVDDKINLIAEMNSFSDIFVYCCIKFYLFLLPVIARSKKMFINKDVASMRNTKMSELFKSLPESVSKNSKLLFTRLCVWGRLP